jgi:hypothetical protein
MSNSSPPLDLIATQINDRLEKVAEADDHRMAAGKLLIEAHERVKRGDAGNVTWPDWVGQNIKRSMADVRKVMALARGKDPETARQQEKRDAKDRMAPGVSCCHNQGTCGSTACRATASCPARKALRPPHDRSFTRSPLSYATLL